MDGMQLGSLTLPDHRLQTLVGDVRRVHEKYPEGVLRDVSKNGTLAQLLGYASERNGSFLSKLTAMRAYGLLEGRAAHARISSLARRIIFGRDEMEQRHAYFECVLRIPLWKELHAKHRFELPPTGLWRELVEITGCPEPDAKSNEDFVRRAYQEDIDPIKGITLDRSPFDAGSDDSQYIEVRAGKKCFVRVEFTEEGRRFVIQALEKLTIGDDAHVTVSKPPGKVPAVPE